jgi:hypothetical protein
LDSEPILVAKIERLQRDLFWTKTVSALIFFCLSVGIIVNWPRYPKTVVAEEFVLKDRTGNIVAKLGQYGFGDTCLTLTAKQNVSVASLCVQEGEGASLDLHNLKRESRVMLTPGLNLYEPMSHVPATFVMSERGQIIYSIPPHANNAEPF